MKITIKKLASPEHWGDWHDKPLRWEVAGPGDERQKFITKVNAQEYAAFRRRSVTQIEAFHLFCHS